MLKNVHLAPVWLVQLEKKLHSLQPHPSFRLFLTTEISPKLPVNLLRAGRVLVFEPPPGIRANLLRTFATVSAPSTRTIRAACAARTSEIDALTCKLVTTGVQAPTCHTHHYTRASALSAMNPGIPKLLYLTWKIGYILVVILLKHYLYYPRPVFLPIFFFWILMELCISGSRSTHDETALRAGKALLLAGVVPWLANTAIFIYKYFLKK